MTVRDLNQYLITLMGSAVGMVLTVIGATWFLNDKISEVRQDVAVIKTRLDERRVPQVEWQQADGNHTQWQYTFVALPPLPLNEAELRDIRVRENAARIMEMDDAAP